MTVFAVIDASRRHCGQMARKLRHEHEAGTRSMGLGTHEGITVAFLMASTNKAWMIDGRLAAVGGVIDTLGSSTGVIWLAIAQDATRYPIAMFKTASHWLKLFGEGKRELRTTIITKDRSSARFAERLGFLWTGEATDDGSLIVMHFNCGGA